MSIEEKFAVIQKKEEQRALGAQTVRELVPAPKAPEADSDATVQGAAFLRLESERKDALIAEQMTRLEVLDRRVRELERENTLLHGKLEALNVIVEGLQKQLGDADSLVIELQGVIKSFENKEVFEWPPESKLNPMLRKLIVSFLEKGDMGGLENLLDRLIRYDDKLPTLLKHTYFKEKVEELYGRYFKRNFGPVRRGTDTNPGMQLSGTSGGTTLGFGPTARTLGILFIDLDNFKTINDKMGHDTGDVTLERVAAAVNESLRQADIKGRFGGEELEAAIELENPADGQKVARKIVEAIAALKITHKQYEFGVTASVGVAELQPGEDLDGLINRANWAMKYAKHMGKNRFIPAELDDSVRWVEKAQKEEVDRKQREQGGASQ